jgi:hypothetical protein
METVALRKEAPGWDRTIRSNSASPVLGNLYSWLLVSRHSYQALDLRIEGPRFWETEWPQRRTTE